MATLIIELLRTKHLLFYINQSRTALNGSLEISPYWRFPVLGAKHKKDPFLIACICILLLNQKVEDATVLTAVSAALMPYVIATTNMLPRFILTFTIILGQWLLPCVATCPHLQK